MTEEQLKNFEQYAISRHEEVHHYYDKYLPYEFHLRLVVKCGRQFRHLIRTFTDRAAGIYMKKEIEFLKNIEDVQLRAGYYGGIGFDVERSVFSALYGHDLLEDTHTSYNDIRDFADEYTAELIFALTNSKGRNRKERQNQAYYDGLHAVPGGVFCKLCDRIANVEYGKLMNSRQLLMYRSELEEFKEKLWDKDLVEMFDYLNELLK